MGINSKMSQTEKLVKIARGFLLEKKFPPPSLKNSWLRRCCVVSIRILFYENIASMHEKRVNI